MGGYRSQNSAQIREVQHLAAEGCCAPVDNCEVACVCKGVDHEIREAVSERQTKDKLLYRTMHNSQHMNNRPLSHKQKYAIKIFFFVLAKAMKALALNVCHVERSWLKCEEDWNQNTHFMTFQK